MKSQYFRFAVLLVSALALGGCAAALEGFPDRVAEPNRRTGLDSMILLSVLVPLTNTLA